jgi:hypothetical protein
MASKHHKHTFHAMYWHFGQYGQQNVHVHPCFDDDCDRVLIGRDRECGGAKSPHVRHTLTDEPSKVPVP